MNGDILPADFDNEGIDICLRSGESMILQTYDSATISKPKEISKASFSKQENQKVIELTGPWKLSFTEEAPKVTKTFTLDKLQTWESLDDDSAKVTMGTGIDVRESARVYINGQMIGCAWAVPFILDCRNALKAGQNEIRIEVTNLPANRIADYDRKGIKWRKMEEINVVDINYKRTTYDHWELVPSGLNSQVRLIAK